MKSPKPPKIAPPPPMPDPDDTQIRNAQRKSTAAMLRRSGRASTDLSGTDTIGGSGQKLGG